jgi:hypothetical protein
MLAKILLCAALIGGSTSGRAEGGQATPAAARPIPVLKAVRLPGTPYEIASGTPGPRLGGVASRQALLKAIVTWLAINFELPMIDSYPSIRLAPKAEISRLRATGSLSAGLPDGAGASSGRRDVVAIYDAANQTIYLPDDWTGNSPAELSMLVHEMVHHLQNVARTRFECPQAREEQAYAVQENWLRLFGHDLATDFSIDPFTLLVSSQCLY